MNLAFYAPLKPPNHPTPSGDRAMARGLIKALEFGGATVTLASTLRSRDGNGDAQWQEKLAAQAAAQLPQIIKTGRAEKWRAWVTYHNYYKAPDLIGWQAAKALGIPYLQIEATRARKRLDGPWAAFARAAETACDSAQAIFYLTNRDAEALKRDAPTGQKIFHLHPFLDRETLPAAGQGNGPLLAVGMMRKGDKLASYQILAQTLRHLPPSGWHLEIAGDGPTKAEVAALFAPFGPAVTFLGALTQTELAAAYGRASLLVWPGVNEAFGMVYLEAQARGVPVIAQNRPGVCDVLAPGQYPDVEAGPAALAHCLLGLMNNATLRKQVGADARLFVEKNHLLPAAAQTLRRGLTHVGVSQ